MRGSANDAIVFVVLAGGGIRRGRCPPGNPGGIVVRQSAVEALAIEGAVPVRVDRDGALLEALRRRDATAAERLVARYGGRAYRLAIGITRNAADAEEVVQDAFWSVIRKIDTFRGDAAFGSWLYRIVANAAFQSVRQGVHRRADMVLPSFHEDGEHAASIDDWSARLDDPALRTDLRSALSSAIDALSPAYRAVVVLRDMQGLSMAEVAHSVGITVANAKTRLHRARLFLRKRLAAFMATTGSEPPSTSRPSQQEEADDERKTRDRSGLHGRRAERLRDLVCEERPHPDEGWIGVSDDQRPGFETSQRLRVVGVS